MTATKTVLTHIAQLLQVRETPESPLVGTDFNELPLLENAYLKISDGRIEAFGHMENLGSIEGYTEIDCSHRLVLPAYVDSHTHLVYAGDRTLEFADRIQGLTYAEIAEKGGGILNSAALLAKTDEETLYHAAFERLQQAIQLGTGAIEIKTGYGLSTEAELKMLRVIERLRSASPIPIKATYLAAHAVPTAFKSNPDAYVDLIINETLPQVAALEIAEYIDVFLETNYFNNAQTERILAAAAQYQLKPKIHVNQFTTIGGITTAVKHGALSVDHLEVMAPEDYDALANSKTVAVALPSCSFFIQIPYTPAKELIQRNIPLVLATDFNPGTSPSLNMNFVVALACIQMKLTAEQALNAATLNAAFALELQHELGSIAVGKRAQLIITKPMRSYWEIPYYFGNNPIERVIN